MKMAYECNSQHT